MFLHPHATKMCVIISAVAVCPFKWSWWLEWSWRWWYFHNTTPPENQHIPPKKLMVAFHFEMVLLWGTCYFSGGVNVYCHFGRNPSASRFWIPGSPRRGKRKWPFRHIGVWRLPLENLVKLRWYNFNITSVFLGCHTLPRHPIFVWQFVSHPAVYDTPVSGKLPHINVHTSRSSSIWAGPINSLAKTRAAKAF